MYTYNQAGAKLGKRLRIQRQMGRSAPYNDVVTVTQDLDSTYTYDNEGKMNAQQYPLSGPNLGYAYDTMGRLNTMTDLGASASIINATTYGPAGQLLTMSGNVNETRTYNSMLQLTQLTSSGASAQVNITYNYSATQNNGKITSQVDALSGETVQYTYDSLNRLASAVATNNSWGQSYGYDGFGNLTDQNVIAGSPPAPHVVADPATNRIVGGSYDANGNDLSQGSFDIENRLIQGGWATWQYSYAPDNKRVWRGVWTSGTQTTDEVTYWSVTGQKLATYSIYMTPYGTNPPVMTITQAATNYYFGGKLIKNGGGGVYADRLGSIGKYYPYGQEPVRNRERQREIRNILPRFGDGARLCRPAV